jgi:CBS domain-containing protein
MRNIGQLLAAKGHSVCAVAPTASVLDAVRLMAERGVGALVVMEGSALVGMLSERDYARQVILKGRSSNTTRVDEIMTRRVLYAEPDQGVEHCLALMTEKRIRHLPVIEAGAVVGVVSIGDLVKEVISDQRLTIEQLEHYISN